MFVAEMRLVRVLWRSLPPFVRTWLAARFGDVDGREPRGYGVWLTMGGVVALPELWAAVDANVPWPTISGTIGHLEYRWSVTAVVVVGALVFSALLTIRYPPPLPPRSDAGIGRTPSGRLSMQPERASRRQLSPWAYFPAAAVVVIGGSLLSVMVDGDKWHLAYVLYGLIAMFWIALPSAAAYLFARDVPFPTLFRTIADLERRMQRFALFVAAGLVVLLLHLAFYPWPDISHVLQKAPPTTSSP
jgi:hypothetical protein